MISDVKQATLVADGRFQNNHAGAGTYGKSASGTLVYHIFFGAAAGDMYQEYISDDGILFKTGIYADLTNCNAASIIWG